MIPYENMKQALKQIQIFEQAIPKKLCQTLIQAYEGDRRVAKDPQPHYSKRTYLKITEYENEPRWKAPVQKLYNTVESVTSSYFMENSKYPEVTLDTWGDDGFLMSKYSKGDSLILHVDGQTSCPPGNFYRLATLVMFLNDVPEGGQLRFPYQGITIKPKTGRCVIFPPTHHFPHEVLPCTQNRYIVQTWIIDPRFKIIDSGYKV